MTTCNFARSFSGAQVFYADPGSVDGSEVMDICAVDLYFRTKPDNILSSSGSMGLVYVMITETVLGVPRITKTSDVFIGKSSCLSVDDIATSSDASVPTTFHFRAPIQVETGKSYAIVYEFGAGAQFQLWFSTQGEILTGTTSVSPGPSSKFIGQFFESKEIFSVNDSDTFSDFNENWRPRNDMTMKFSLKAARYAHGGVPVLANGSIDTDDIQYKNPGANVTANSTNVGFNINFGSHEYITFNEDTSTKTAFTGGQMAYQNTFFYPGGYQGNTYINLTTNADSKLITANVQYPNGDNFQWSSIFAAVNPDNRVVVTDGTTVNIRTLQTIRSNTVIEVTEPVTFTNADSKLMVTPTGRISSFNKSSPFGVDSGILMLSNSSANSTVRFVNNSITATAITAGGSGYSNNDVFYIKGFENVADKVTGGYVAAANLVTNSTGGITTLHFSNLGCGFVNTGAIVVTVANSSEVGNTTSNTSAGSGATFSYTIGSDVRTEYGNSIFRKCEVRNFGVGEFIPFYEISQPAGAPTDIVLETNYYQKADTSVLSGEVTYVNDGTSNNQMDIVLYNSNHTKHLAESPVIPSRSNEFSIVYENGDPNDKTGNVAHRSSESLRILNDITHVNDFNTFRCNHPKIEFSKYLINNDATNEHTDSGNAYAKGMTQVFNFNQTAEDIRLFITAYKPANTDIKVYGRIYKNEDPAAFDDKNWTELELKNADSNFVSSSTDKQDYIELEYGFYQVPQTRTDIGGVVEVQSANTTVLGSPDALYDADLAAGDLLYFYQPLFVENHFLASVVSVTSNTEFEMDFSTANVSILAEGMKIEKVTYPEQGFNNIQNDNIVRYYNANQSKFDGYESLAVKIVFLSDSDHKIPRVDDIQGAATSV